MYNIYQVDNLFLSIDLFENESKSHFEKMTMHKLR